MRERRKQRGGGDPGEAREKRPGLSLQGDKEGCNNGRATSTKREEDTHRNPTRETTRLPRTQRFREAHPHPGTPHAFRLCHEP